MMKKTTDFPQKEKENYMDNDAFYWGIQGC